MVEININNYNITTLNNMKICDERNMRYYWLITVSHYLFFLMNGVVFFASVMVCRIRNGVLRLYRLFVITGVSV